jgi:hypothetical protein
MFPFTGANSTETASDTINYFGAIKDTLQTTLMPATFALAYGYLTCMMLFGENKWRSSPKKEITIYSSIAGGGVTVILLGVIFAIETMSPELQTIIGGNEAYLTAIFLILIGFIQLVAVAIKRSKERKKINEKRKNTIKKK